MKKALIVFALVVTAVVTHAQVTVDEQYVQTTLSKGKTYTMVLLKKGNTFGSQSPQEIQKLQMGHLKHLFTLKEQGKVAIFGPFTDNGDIRGYAIATVTDRAELEKLLAEDPFIKAGYLVYELHPCFGIPGQNLP